MHQPRLRKWAGVVAGVSFALLVAGCGSSDPDAHGFPWQVRPTPDPSLIPVPVPTSDGDPTPEPDPVSQFNIDLIATALVDQGLTLRGIHDTDRAAVLEEGVHYTRQAVIEETSSHDDNAGRYETFGVVYQSLEPNGSVVTYRTVHEIDHGQDNPDVTVRESEYWRVDLSGARHPIDSPVGGPDFSDEVLLAECPEHYISRHVPGGMESSDDLGGRASHWSLVVRSRDGAFEEVRRVDFEGLSWGWAFPVACSAEVAVLFGESEFRSGGTEVFGSGRPAVLEHFDWVEIAAAGDAIVAILRDADTRSSIGKGYIVHVDLAESAATIYTTTVSSSIWSEINFGNDLMAVEFVSGTRTPTSLFIDLQTGVVARVEDDYGYQVATSGEYIGIRGSWTLNSSEPHGQVHSAVYVIGSWIRQ